MIQIDTNKRLLVYTNEKTRNRNINIINEYDKIKHIFLPNTQDTYECELVFLEVDVLNEFGDPTGNKELKPFARRVGKGCELWLETISETYFDLDYVEEMQ